MRLNDAYSTTVFLKNVIEVSSYDGYPDPSLFASFEDSFCKTVFIFKHHITKMSPVRYITMLPMDRNRKCVVKRCISSSVTTIATIVNRHHHIYCCHWYFHHYHRHDYCCRHQHYLHRCHHPC